MRTKLGYLSAVALGVLGSYQTASAQGLEEITVTARRVEENLMQVPLAISAIGAGQIQDTGVQNLQDLLRFTSGVVSTPGTNTGRVGGPFNRGPSALVFRGLSVATGQVFIDGAPFAGSATPDVTDVSRVEVLKGPQAVYFGRSTYSGAVNYVTKEPGDKFGGYVIGDLANYGTVNLNAGVEGPITEKVGVRVSGRFYTTSGQYVNPLQGDRLGAQQTSNFAVNAVFKPSDALKIKAYYAWAQNDDGMPAQGILVAGSIVQSPTNINQATYSAVGGDLTCRAGGTVLYYCGTLPSVNTLLKQNPLAVSAITKPTPLVRALTVDNRPVFVAALGRTESYPTAFDPNWLTHMGYKLRTQSAHLGMEYVTQNDWTLTSTTAWDSTKSEAWEDYNFRDVSNVINPNYVSATATPLLSPFNDRPSMTQTVNRDFSQEFRVTSPSKERLRGVAGASWLRIITPFNGLLGFNQTGTVQNNLTETLSKTPAVFGAVYYDFTDQFTLSAEARYQWDKISQKALWPIPGAALQQTYTSFSPRVSLDYKFSQDALLYALWSRGYRPGGFNIALVSNPAGVVAQLATAGGQLAYQQEKLDNFEAGIKWTGLENRLRVIFDAYYMKWQNGQVTQSIFVTQANGALAAMSIILNQGRVNLKGVESEVAWAATDHLTLSGSFSYMKNKIVNFQDVVNGPRIYGSTSAAGYELPGAPKLTFSTSAEYKDHFVGDWDWLARTDLTYRGGMYIDTHQIAQTAPSYRVNIRVGLETTNVRVEGYVNNVFNNMEATEVGIANNNINALAATQAIRYTAPQKRLFGIKASYKF